MTGPGPRTSKQIRVLLIDSNQIEAQLLNTALNRQAGLRVKVCDSELSECLAALEAAPADVVLLSGIVQGNGIAQFDLLHQLHSLYPQLAVVILLDSYDRDLVVAALRAGVRGLFCRDSLPFKALCRCIHAVHDGQFWMNSEQFRFVVEALMQSPALHVTNAVGKILLTPRELQIATLVSEGLSNRQIARELHVTENTIKKALLRIFDRLGVSNRVELVLYMLTQHDVSTAAPATACFPFPGKAAQPVCLPKGERRVPGSRVAPDAVSDESPVG